MRFLTVSLPIAWLVFVLVAYAALALHPWTATAAPVPFVEQASRWAGPLLACLLLTGIMGYFRHRGPHADQEAESSAPRRNPSGENL
jgi:hypothetical protein